MAAAELLELESSDAVGRYLGLDGPLPGHSVHLPECSRRHDGEALPCDWCRLAIQSPELVTLVGVGRDARTLLGCQATESVAGVVAYARLVELFRSVTYDGVRAESSRHIVETARSAATADLDRLRHRIQHAVGPGGPVEGQCLRTAGALAALALQAGNGPPPGVDIPDVIRRDMVRLTADLSAPIRLATFLPVVEQLHQSGLPPLSTQPEWNRRHPPRPGSLVARQLAGARLPAGSLESLVLEAVLAEHTDLLLALGDGLIDVGPTVTISRPTSERGHRGATRDLIWRVSRFDWHLTFIDTHLAICWSASSDLERHSARVPWVVSQAIDISLRAGLTSALYPTQPIVSRPPS